MAALLPASNLHAAPYVSPYQWAASVTNSAVAPDFDVMPRVYSNYTNWSTTPYSEWNDYDIVYIHIGAWGPDFVYFPAPTNVLTEDLSWQQLRIAASANVLRGQYPYAHHHMQVWDPPNSSPWTNASVTPGFGIDCSDFTHWNYNYGLGVQFTTAVAAQGEIYFATLTPENQNPVNLQVQRLFDVHAGYEKNFTNLVAQLQPGDLLFIRANPAFTNVISHVITWLGDLASDSNGLDQYLVTDSHGDVVIDSNGVEIPSGPQIRPFRFGEYYYGSFDHVIRLLPLTPLPTPIAATVSASLTNQTHLAVTITGTTGNGYILQSSPDLGGNNWVNITTNFAPYSAKQRISGGAQFYRAVSFP